MSHSIIKCIVKFEPEIIYLDEEVSPSTCSVENFESNIENLEIKTNNEVTLNTIESENEDLVYESDDNDESESFIPKRKYNVPTECEICGYLPLLYQIDCDNIIGMKWMRLKQKRRKMKAKFSNTPEPIESNEFPIEIHCSKMSSLALESPLSSYGMREKQRSKTNNVAEENHLSSNEMPAFSMAPTSPLNFEENEINDKTTNLEEPQNSTRIRLSNNRPLRTPKTPTTKKERSKGHYGPCYYCEKEKYLIKFGFYRSYNLKVTFTNTPLRALKERGSQKEVLLSQVNE